MIKEFKKSIKRLEHWERLADQTLEAWEADPMNEDREKAADRFYDLEWNEWNHACNLLVKLTGIEEKTARYMLNRGNREKVMDILTRYKEE